MHAVYVVVIMIVSDVMASHTAERSLTHAVCAVAETTVSLILQQMLAVSLVETEAFAADVIMSKVVM